MVLQTPLTVVEAGAGQVTLLVDCGLQPLALFHACTHVEYVPDAVSPENVYDVPGWATRVSPGGFPIIWFGVPSGYCSRIG